MRFDLRDESGAALPLLTRAENGRISAWALIAHAERLLAPRPLPPPLLRVLAYLATRPLAASISYARALLVEDSEEWRWTGLRGAPEARRILAADDLYRDLISLFLDRSLIFTPLTLEPRERRVVKISYDEESTRESLSGTGEHLNLLLGWRSQINQVDASLIGSARTYHFEILLPPDVEMTYAGLLAREPRHWLERRFSKELGADPEPPKPDFKEPSAAPRRAERRAHLYVADAEQAASGIVWVALRARRSGFLLGAVLATALIAAVLIFYAADADALVDVPSSAVALLLLVPGLLAGIAVRPGEHDLARMLYRGPRLLVALAGLLTVLATGVLLALAPQAGSAEAGDLDAPACLRWSWAVLAVAATVLAAATIRSYRYPSPGDGANRSTEPAPGN